MRSKFVSAMARLLDQHRGRLFDVGPQCLQELRAHSAVDDTVVDRERAAHHIADHHLALARHHPLLAYADGKDHRLWWIDDGGKFLDAEHAEIGDREPSALEFIEL